MMWIYKILNFSTGFRIFLFFHTHLSLLSSLEEKSIPNDRSPIQFWNQFRDFFTYLTDNLYFSIHETHNTQFSQITVIPDLYLAEA